MKRYNKEIQVYDFEGLYDGFCVEVHKNKTAIEFYLYHKSYGIKELMFGVLPDETEWMIENLISININDYINYYTNAYMIDRREVN